MVMRTDDGFVLSPSDLTASTGCEFGWLRAQDVKAGLIPAPAGDEDPLLVRLAMLGDEHEAAHLARMRSEGRSIMEIRRPDPYTPHTLQQAMAETLDALRDDADVVAQAALTDGGFGGQADFLVRDSETRYEVWDAKLARHAKVTALLQIAAYADLLDQHDIPRSPQGFLLLGDGRIHVEPLDDVIAVYRHRRARLEDLLSAHLATAAPAVWNSGSYTQCGTCEHCAAEVEATSDLLLVAGLRRSQRERLRAGGITTIGELASSGSTVAGLPERTWRTLRAQAEMQVAPVDDGQIAFQVFDANPIRRLPAPDPGDMYFDFEGDPLWTDGSTHDAGLEYLFGWVLDDGTFDGSFTPLWAHDRAGEKVALEAFLAYVRERWAAHPGMHIYHYAAYEVTALKRLTVRHTVGEDFLDELLRAGVFVDLYAVVRQAVRISQSSYSIKQLEPLYMGEHLRTGVTTAADSIVEYEKYRVAAAKGDDETAQRILDEIATYNRYDCTSTMQLLNWLRDVGNWEPPEPVVATTGVDETPAVAQTELGDAAQLARALLTSIPDVDRNAEETAVALLAAALGYHRREKKPAWWAYFSRLSDPVDEWLESRTTLVADGAVEVLEDWTPVKKSNGRLLRLRGHLEAGSAIEAGASVALLFDDLPPGTSLGPGEVRAHVDTGEVVSVAEDEDGVAEVIVLHKRGASMPTFSQTPMAIVEHAWVPDGPLEAVIRSLAESIALDPAVPLPPAPALDVLAHRPPRFRKGSFEGGATTSGDISRVVDSVRSLDLSYVAVQGPPGTGKTHLGSHVVAQLVREGWKVGVVAQGHTTIETFLMKAIAAGLDPARVAKQSRTGDAEPKPWTVLKDRPAHAAFARDQDGGYLIGGTAWAFASEKAFDDAELDLLVIDEAGQFSLANTIVVGRATQRLLLLGDPQQLPQVSQGMHPEPVDRSALEWLTEGAATMPPERGFFLAQTRRMHPKLTTAVSRLSYAGRLASVEDVTLARELTGVVPGIHPVAVVHRDNSVHSVEEADAIVETVRRLLTSTWTEDAEAAPRRMTSDDVIVVAPYNAQVATIRHRLDRAGFGGVRVGTVDKFQGQEAPVVLVSMTASSPADVPRGMDFLLNRNRLNVAVSRGQWAAFVVHSPALADYLPASPEGLAELGSFIHLVSTAKEPS